MKENTAKNKRFHKDTFDKTTEDRRQKVIEVAIEEFASKGYSATSINDITKKAKISIGAMYSYFASKEDLFLSIVNSADILMEKILKEVSDSSKDIFDCVEKMLTAGREFALKYPQLNQIYLDITTQALSHMSVRLSSELERVTPKLLANLIIQAKKDGKIKESLDERVASYCIDNIFMMYQFSFSSDYYKERMKIFLGEEKLQDFDQVEKNILGFIYSALENQPDKTSQIKPAR